MTTNSEDMLDAIGLTLNKEHSEEEHYEKKHYQKKYYEQTLSWLNRRNKNKEEKKIFEGIVKYVQGVDILRKVTKKVIGSYSGQPPVYNEQRMILCSELTNSGKAIDNGWLLRIPQPEKDETPLTLFIPKCFAVTSDTEKVESHDEEKKAIIYPKSIEDFLLHPDQYVDWTKEDTRT